MKKIIKITMTTVLCALLCLMSSCGSPSLEDSKYIGTWEAVQCEYEGVIMHPEDMIGDFTITFNDDGTCKVSVRGKESTGKWKETDCGLRLEDGSDSLEFTEKNNTLKTEYVGITLDFKKKQ